MAKRVRGSGVRSTHRPGGHAPVRGTSARAEGSRPPEAAAGATATAAPAPAPAAASAAVAEPAEIVRSTHGRRKVKADSVLAARAAEEYVYVGKDLRHILIVAVVLFAALIGIWLFLTNVDPFGIY